MDMLAFQWEDGYVPDSPEEVASLVGQPLKDVKKVWEKVRENFSEIEPGKLANSRLHEEREKALAKVAQLQINGKQGGRPKQKVNQTESNCFSGQKPNGFENKTKPKAKPGTYPDKERKPPTGAKERKGQGVLEVLQKLPERYQTDEMREAVAAYERHRIERRHNPWPPSTIEANAKKWLSFAPEDVAAALRMAVERDYRGVDPKWAVNERNRGGAPLRVVTPRPAPSESELAVLTR